MQNISLNFASQNISLLMTAIIEEYFGIRATTKDEEKSMLSCKDLDVTGWRNNRLGRLKRVSFPLIKIID